MTLDRKPQTVGNKRRYIVDYSQWLDTGIVITAATATTTSLTASVTNVSFTNTTLIFYVNDGALNEVFTVSLQITDSNGEIKNDTVEFFVVAP